jgi:hypothetical protein
VKEPDESAAAQGDSVESGCPIKMGGFGSGLRCGRKIHVAPDGVDEKPVCLMHSKDPRKQSGPLFDAFMLEFERILENAGEKVARFERFVFPQLIFSGRKFQAICIFNSVTFTQRAVFNNAIFTQRANFGAATFTKGADFNLATFTQGANFVRATFTQDSIFLRATFTQLTFFNDAIFTQRAIFDEATFT